VIEQRVPSASSRRTSEPSRARNGPLLGISRISLVALLFFVGLALITAVFGWRISRYSPLQRIADASAATPGAEFSGQPTFAWRGAIHVHSTYSDGAGSVEDVIEAAKDAGLDFLILSDHNPLGKSARPLAGWHDDLLLIVGEEISTYEGHILAVGLQPHRYQMAPRARAALTDIEELGGWGWIAHPFHPDESWEAGWAGVLGVELINLAESWARAPMTLRLAVAASYPFDSDYALLRVLSNGLPALSLWDSRTSLTHRTDSRWPRPLIGIAAADAHGPVAWPFPLPTYADTLSAVQTLVWLDIPPVSGPYDAEAAVLSALRRGRATAVVSAIGDAGGFAYEARATMADRVAWAGDMAAWEQGPWRLRASVDVAGDVEIVCLRDGEPVSSVSGAMLEYTPELPGTYRIEVHRLTGPQAGRGANIPWIISNPIYLWPAQARRAALLQRVPPLPAPRSRSRLHTSRRWRVESSDNVSGELNTDGDRPVWTFELPAFGGDNTYAALAWRPRQVQDWSERNGLVADIESSEEMRLIVEIRAETESGATMSWHRSVRTGKGQQPLALPWSEWRQRRDDPRSGYLSSSGEGLDALSDEGPAREDLRRVTGLFLIVTPEILVPGDREEITIREIAVYGGEEYR
jgi:hypothetical protein